MADIKTRNTKKDIKIFDKASTVGDKMKDSYIRTKNNDIIDGSKFVGIVNPVTVSSILDSISNLISTIEKQVEHIADVNYDWGQSVEIKPQQFISNFIRKNATPEFLMTLSNRIEHKTKMFYAPLQAVERVFTNIVTNAKEHGFTDLARNDYEIAFDWFEENGNIVILISNNGNPLKDGVTEDMVFTYGFSQARVPLSKPYKSFEVSKSYQDQ